jgi:predicted nucleic acid-binding protein
MPLVDTNVLIYAISSYAPEREKSRRARSVLQRADCVFSVQVLQEFYVQATRRSRRDCLGHGEAVAFIQALLRFPVQDLTVAVLREALAMKERHQISYWDAAILAAARAAGCQEVLSEDLSHGQDYDGVRVVNPFV